MLHHLAHLLSHFCQLSISPGRTRQRLEYVSQIKVNPSQVRQEMPRPVHKLDGRGNKHGEEGEGEGESHI